MFLVEMFMLCPVFSVLCHHISDWNQRSGTNTEEGEVIDAALDDDIQSSTTPSTTDYATTKLKPHPTIAFGSPSGGWPMGVIPQTPLRTC
jgi:hypothetical protein